MAVSPHCQPAVSYTDLLPSCLSPQQKPRLLDVNASQSTESHAQSFRIRTLGPTMWQNLTLACGCAAYKGLRPFSIKALLQYCHKDLQHCSSIWTVTLSLRSESSHCLRLAARLPKCRQNYSWSKNTKYQMPKVMVRGQPSALRKKPSKSKRAMVG